MKKHLSFFILVILFSCSSGINETINYPPDELVPFKTVVELENTVYPWSPIDNGSGPVWDYGNSAIVRYGDRVIASGMEELKWARGYNVTRWTLYELKKDKWELVAADPLEHTREPSPLAVFDNGRLFMSANPTLEKLKNGWGVYSFPKILEFNIKNLKKEPLEILPEWQGNPDFNHHSYRSFAADGPNSSFILLQHNMTSRPSWGYYSEGEWKNAGMLDWPWGADYEKPQPIRICYPSVQLKDRQVHFFGVSDIVEPVSTWKEYKFKLTGREWDYDFRRLFYIYSKDITTGKFSDWIEIASREETAGYLYPCDLWVDDQNRVHLLWYERALDDRLRKDFFPDAEQSWALNYTVMKDGKKIFEKPLMYRDDNNSATRPFKGRFHITPDNRLFVIFFITKAGGSEYGRGFLRIMQISKDFDFSPMQSINLQQPLNTFYTASPRNGSEPSWYIDLLGMIGQSAVRYSRIRIEYK